MIRKKYIYKKPDKNSPNCYKIRLRYEHLIKTSAAPVLLLLISVFACTHYESIPLLMRIHITIFFLYKFLLNIF